MKVESQRKWLADLVEEDRPAFLDNNLIIARSGIGKTLLPGELISRGVLKGRTLLVTIDDYEKDYVLSRYESENNFSAMTYRELREAVLADRVHIENFQNIFYDEVVTFLDNESNPWLILGDEKCKSFFLTQSSLQFAERTSRFGIEIDELNKIDYSNER